MKKTKKLEQKVIRVPQSKFHIGLHIFQPVKNKAWLVYKSKGRFRKVLLENN